MVRVSYYGYDNISSSLIHVTDIRGCAVKGLHFDCRSKNNGFNSYISLLLLAQR